MTTRGLRIKKIPIDYAIEPVTLEALKAHLSIDFDTHDEMLENEILPAARDMVEQYTGISLIESNVVCRWEELTTCELPYGPIKSLTSVKAFDDTLRTDYSLEGFLGDFVSIKADSLSPVVVSYVACYEGEIPKALQLAIIQCATEMFTHRDGGASDAWKQTAKRYSRKSWFL